MKSIPTKIFFLFLFVFMQMVIVSCDRKSVELESPKIDVENEVIEDLEIIEDLSEKTLFVPYYDPRIRYQGRIDSTSTKATMLFWSSSSITLNFEGTEIKALMQDKNFDTFYTVIVDDNQPFTMQPDSAENFIVLAENLSAGKHSIEVHRNSEWTRGATIFKGFEVKGNPKILPKSAEANRKMEFYGNSVTAGAGVNDTSGADSPKGSLTDSYKSYASITARHFNADQSIICRSGIGIMVSWFDQIMPELYDNKNPLETDSKWDFSLYRPDIVIVNLFQNDSWIVKRKDNNQFIRVFGNTPPTDEFIVNSYTTFITRLREKYPDASIICMLGNMDITKTEQWSNYVHKAVQKMNDDKIYSHFAPFKGTRGHPSIEEHEIMAKSLIGFIENNVDW